VVQRLHRHKCYLNTEYGDLNVSFNYLSQSVDIIMNLIQLGVTEDCGQDGYSVSIALSVKN